MAPKRPAAPMGTTLPPPATNRNGSCETASADEGYKSWRIDGPDINGANHRRGSRNPAPRAPNECPAAIMEGCKAPWLIFHPSPTPGCHKGPMPIMVGRPAYRNPGREPYMA